jgi:hypothetical protein
MIKPFLVHEDDDMKQSRSLIHLGFRKGWLELRQFAGLFQMALSMASDRCI